MNTDNVGLLDKKPEGRQELLQYLKKELIGPLSGPVEELEGEPPHKRYTMGILFPSETLIDNETEGEEAETGGVEGGDEIADDPVTLSGQYMPSSMGMSFFYFGEPELEISLYGAQYIKVKETKKNGSESLLQRKTRLEKSSFRRHKMVVAQYLYLINLRAW